MRAVLGVSIVRVRLCALSLSSPFCAVLFHGSLSTRWKDALSPRKIFCEDAELHTCAQTFSVASILSPRLYHGRHHTCPTSPAPLTQPTNPRTHPPAHPPNPPIPTPLTHALTHPHTPTYTPTQVEWGVERVRTRPRVRPRGPSL